MNEHSQPRPPSLPAAGQHAPVPPRSATANAANQMMSQSEVNRDYGIQDFDLGGATSACQTILVLFEELRGLPLPGRRRVRRRARPGGSAVVAFNAGGALGANRAALRVYHLLLVLGLERSGLGRAHGGR